MLLLLLLVVCGVDELLPPRDRRLAVRAPSPRLGAAPNCYGDPPHGADRCSLAAAAMTVMRGTAGTQSVLQVLHSRATCSNRAEGRDPALRTFAIVRGLTSAPARFRAGQSSASEDQLQATDGWSMCVCAVRTRADCRMRGNRLTRASWHGPPLSHAASQSLINADKILPTPSCAVTRS